MALKSFDAISFRKHLKNQIEREGEVANRFKHGDTILELREYAYHCGKNNALSQLLEDMNLFAEFTKDTEENKNE